MVELKAGLEIHQQLDTSKLFCRCPSILRSDKPDIEIRRKLHVVAGESGEVDIAAEYEASKKKEFIYQGYSDTTCLIELDEEPPRMINSDALKIAVQISLLLNCRIIPLTQIMRKTVIDGSNTSGFQRTVLIAEDGYVETEHGKVRIESVALEEDAARIISKGEKINIFRLDRLGIPLVEITTAPEIKSPEQAQEVALHIGEILRSCKVKRGIGTIRQDVNMSITGGKRVEIKGFQDIKNIKKTIEKEIERQAKLVKEKQSRAEVRNALPSGETEFLRPLPGAARMYPETDLPLLKISKKFVDEIKKSLPELRTHLRKELKEQGLSEDTIRSIFKDRKLEEFKELVSVYNSPKLVAQLLILLPKEIASHKKISMEKVRKRLNLDVLETILEAVQKNKIQPAEVKEVMKNIVEGKSVKDALKKERIGQNEAEEKIIKLLRKRPGLSTNAYMGLLMKELKGKIDGKTLIELIRKHLPK